MEFTLAMPMLLMMITGIVLFAFWMNTQIAVNSAARSAARQCAIGAEMDEVAEETGELLQGYGVKMELDVQRQGSEYQLSKHPRAELAIEDRGDSYEAEVRYSMPSPIPGLIDPVYSVSAESIYREEVD